MLWKSPLKLQLISIPAFVVPPCPPPSHLRRTPSSFGLPRGNACSAMERGMLKGLLCFNHHPGHKMAALPPFRISQVPMQMDTALGAFSWTYFYWNRLQNFHWLQQGQTTQYVYNWNLNNLHENDSAALSCFLKILSGQGTRSMYEILVVSFFISLHYLLQNTRGKHLETTKDF